MSGHPDPVVEASRRYRLLEHTIRELCLGPSDLCDHDRLTEIARLVIQCEAELEIMAYSTPTTETGRSLLWVAAVIALTGWFDGHQPSASMLRSLKRFLVVPGALERAQATLH